MKRFFFGLLCTAVLAASASAQEAEVIYQIDFEASSDINNADPDAFRFTTFTANIGTNFAGQGLDLDGNMVNNATAFGNAVLAINHNDALNGNGGPNGNQGTGFFYLPTNVAWLPNTTYSIDFALVNRTTDAANPGNSGVDGATIEVGLFAGLPADHAANLATFPNRQGSGPVTVTYDAQTKPSLGTAAFAVLDFEAGEGFRYISNDANATQFSFTTGADVSDLDEMVLFVRNTLVFTRLHLDDINISATPAEEFLLGDVNCSGVVNFLDIAPFIAVLSSGGNDPKADTNVSGNVNFLDIAPFIAILSGQ